MKRRQFLEISMLPVWGTQFPHIPEKNPASIAIERGAQRDIGNPYFRLAVDPSKGCCFPPRIINMFCAEDRSSCRERLGGLLKYYCRAA